jgi:hypothetical protein
VRSDEQQIKIRNALKEDEGHSLFYHNGLALTQSGLVRGCRRCRLLKLIEPIPNLTPPRKEKENE